MMQMYDKKTIDKLYNDFDEYYVALSNLINKLEECQGPIIDAFMLAYNVRGAKYNGPHYEKEFEHAKKLLNDST